MNPIEDFRGIFYPQLHTKYLQRRQHYSEKDLIIYASKIYTEE